MLTQKTRHGISDLTLQGKDILGSDKLGTGKILDFPLNLSLIQSRPVPLYVSWPFLFFFLGAPSTIAVTCSWDYLFNVCASHCGSSEMAGSFLTGSLGPRGVLLITPAQ